MKYYSKKVGNISCAAYSGFLTGFKSERMDMMTEEQRVKRRISDANRKLLRPEKGIKLD